MTLNDCYNKVSRLEKELSDLQNKIAFEARKELDKQKQIDSISRSINNSTSSSALQAKQNQIRSNQNEMVRIQSAKADLYKKVAGKTQELMKAKQELQKEEVREKDKLKKDQENFKKQQEDFHREQQDYRKEQELLQRKLQNDIKGHKEIINTLVTQIHSASMDKGTIEQKEYDFFISHATEDKESFVRPLAELLSNNGHKVWYDEFQLKLGDSLRRKIDEGLLLSKYGIVVLSRDFFRKNWTEYELNGLVAREMNGVKVILPIWHNVTRDEVLSFSPTLADKIALNTAIYSLAEIAEELKKLVDI